MNPKLSIIVGAKNARDAIKECLSDLEKQSGEEGVEIIVVDGSSDGTAEIVSKGFPNVKLIRHRESLLMPQLWEIGISQSTGDIVAIITAHCIPREDWIEQILKKHETRYAGIGGAVENDPESGLVGWAIYFTRYSSYMLPFSEVHVKDFAGDNASYKRSALNSCKDARSEGFWEPFVHAELINKGFELLKTPEIVVYHKKSFTMSGFIRQRFLHGRQFGSSRASGISGTVRAMYIISSPLIPFVLLYRVAQRVIVKKRYVTKFLLSLPVTAVFFLSWTVGEVAGYIRRPKDSMQF